MGVSPLDLVAVGDVQGFLNNPLPGDNDKIQGCITAASFYWLWKTGRLADSAPADHSPLKEVTTYDGWYDGNGSYRMFLRVTPVVTVALLTVNGITIPQSTSVTVPGWVIDGSGKSIVIRQGYGVRTPRRGCSYWSFQEGVQNIEVQYTAGYASTPGDIVDATIRMVANNFRRRDWLGLKQQADSKSPMGQMIYDWDIEPWVQNVIDNYSRQAIV